MTKNFTRWALAACGVASALALTSCYYDPYYSGGSASYGYSSYGYGGGSTSVFISTGDPRWGYDPYYNCYYDYNRRAYYDPYLYGYYPVGFFPPVVYGVPHPYGWRPGSRYCPPPRGVRYTTLSSYSYRNRASAYQSSNFSWARQARQTSAGRTGSPPQQNFGNQPRGNGGNNNGPGRNFGNQQQPRGNVRGSQSSTFTQPRQNLESGRQNFGNTNPQTRLTPTTTSTRQIQRTSPDSFSRSSRSPDFQQRGGGGQGRSFTPGQQPQFRQSSESRPAPSQNRSNESRESRGRDKLDKSRGQQPF